MPLHCPAFGECGGCATLDRPYEEQLAAKRAALRKLLGREIEIAPSPDLTYYRNRMDFAVGGGAAGLFRRGDWGRVVDVHACLLLSPEAMPILRRFREGVTRRGLDDYDRRRRAGFVRFLVIREGKFTGERLLNVVTSPGESGPIGEIAEELRREFPVTGVVHSVTDSPADLSRGKPVAHWGRDIIEEDLDGVRLAMGPNSFFQPNSAQAKTLFAEIAAAVPGGARVLDLYCGVGSIGLYVGGPVRGVDNDAENIELARRNTERNRSAATFELRDAGRCEVGDCDVLMVDPPRAGLHPKLAARIAEKGPGRVVYVSCNPEALARDLERLRYPAASLHAFDMCPHTPHVEVLALLDR